MYDLNYTLLVETHRSLNEIIINLPTIKNTSNCKNGWNYDRSLYENTVVMEVCCF